MVILNEKEYAEHVIKHGIVGKKPSQTLMILAKYYYSLGYTRDEIHKLLVNFMQKNHVGFNYVKWSKTINNCAKHADKYKLLEIDSVGITQKELDTIARLDDKWAERLAFTYLCFAKLYNVIHKNNNNWTNCDDSTIFSTAKIYGNEKSRGLIIKTLLDCGLISLGAKVDNINTRVLFIEQSEDFVLYVDDFRNLGYLYSMWRGEGFVRCKECGLIFKQKCDNEYCYTCRTNNEKKRIFCIDCGKILFVKKKNTKTIRCNVCQAKADRSSKLEYKNKKANQQTKN